MPNTVAAAPPATPFARTKSDNDMVLAMFKPFAAAPAIQALQTEVLSDPALTIETIQARLLVEMGKGVTPVNPAGAHPRIETMQDETDTIREQASNALLARSGIVESSQARKLLQGNPYARAGAYDIAIASLNRIGVKSGFGKEDNVMAAFTQGTSDFPIILENTMHRALQLGYEAEAQTWRRFCAVGSLSDLRQHNRYRMGGLSVLDDVNELGEFINKSISDGEKASIKGSTKGNIINVSADTIINDDLGVFVGLANRLGHAGAVTVERDVYALLALNTGLGPVMADGLTLFHATHNNITAGSALSMAAIDLDRVAMAIQKDIGDNEYLALRPATLLVNTSLGGTARTINEALYDPDTANKLQKPNQVNGLFGDIVDSPRVSGTRRYLFAGANVAPVIEVAFLDGEQTPDIRMEEGFDVDGVRWRVRMRYGVAALDYRGAVTNAGV